MRKRNRRLFRNLVIVSHAFGTHNRGGAGSRFGLGTAGKEAAMMMTLQNAMRQQPGQMMFPRNAVKLDPGDHFGHHLSAVESLHPTFTGVGDAFEGKLLLALSFSL